MLLHERELVAFQRPVDEPRQQYVGDFMGRRVELQHAAGHVAPSPPGVRTLVRVAATKEELPRIDAPCRAQIRRLNC